MAWKDFEKKAETVVVGEKTTVLSWARAHKGWLVTTGLSHLAGWLGSALVRHLL